MEKQIKDYESVCDLARISLGNMRFVLGELGELFAQETEIKTEITGSICKVNGVLCVYASAGEDRRYAVGPNALAWNCPVAPHEVNQLGYRDMATLMLATSIGALPRIPEKVWEDVIGDGFNAATFREAMNILGKYTKRASAGSTLVVGLCGGSN